MTKFSEDFKLRVVEACLKGKPGAKKVAKQHGIDDGTVRKWVASYRVRGAKGLKKKFSHYDAEFKLSVLKHMWENGLSHRETAALFDIRNTGCLTVWERRYRSGGIKSLAPRRKGRPKTMSEPGSKQLPTAGEDQRSREELLAELSYLRMENDYLKKLKALVQAKEAQKKRK